MRSTEKAGRPLKISKPKQIIFTAILICSSLALVLAAGETFLRFRKQSIQKSDALAPGLVVYDRYLGWALAPNWQGGHRHHDFDVRYTTNAYGFRGRFDAPASQKVQHDAGLVLVLMPGRSLVERPASQSAQFQEYLRARLVESSRQLDIEVLDLASYLKTQNREKNMRLFHLHEGHLTAAGHRVTADFIHSRLKASSHGRQ